MASKSSKMNLAAALHGAANAKPANVSVPTETIQPSAMIKSAAPQPAVVAAPRSAPRARGEAVYERVPSRSGKKILSVYVDPKISRKFKLIALEEETSVHALMIEALDDFLAKRGQTV